MATIFKTEAKNYWYNELRKQKNSFVITRNFLGFFFFFFIKSGIFLKKGDWHATFLCISSISWRIVYRRTRAFSLTRSMVILRVLSASCRRTSGSSCSSVRSRCCRFNMQKIHVSFSVHGFLNSRIFLPPLFHKIMYSEEIYDAIAKRFPFYFYTFFHTDVIQINLSITRADFSKENLVQNFFW